MNIMIFFYSSRRRHTRLQGDWSSDVCSSDLRTPSTSTDDSRTASSSSIPTPGTAGSSSSTRTSSSGLSSSYERGKRSEERRVGRECGRGCRSEESAEECNDTVEEESVYEEGI